jgi:hypothetical protein
MTPVRVLVVLCAVFTVGGLARAQLDPDPKDGKVTIPVTLSPAAAPKPLANYYLIPEYRDKVPGEMLAGFLKCFMEQDVFFNRENTEKRYKMLEVPLADLPADVRETHHVKNGLAYDPKYASLMVFMDQAARYNRVEWNEYFNLRNDGAYMLLPEIQKLRTLADVLHLRLRGEVKNREFQRALVTVKTMFGLGKMLETHPCLIGNLVGIAICTKAVHGLEEMIQQPGCPNLYWSFADLPGPLMDLRQSLGGERVFLLAQMEGLLKANRALSGKELNVYVKMIEDLTKLEGGLPSDEVTTRLAAFVTDEKQVAAARRRMVDAGQAAEVVNSFPPMQVALLEDLHRYEVLRDEVMKWINMPYAAAMKGLLESEETIKKAKADGAAVLGPILLPAVMKVKQAQVRLDQRVAYLRTLEAIRLTTQANGGNLPKSLEAIGLPLLTDPVTGAPFAYAVDGDTATLSGANPSPGNERTNRTFVIRLAK